MWLDNLRAMKDRSGLTTKEISKQSGIPEPTLEKLFAGATKDPKLPTMQKLVHFLGYTLDDLDGTPKKEDYLSAKEKDHIKKYRSLDPEGQEAVDVILDVEYRRCTKSEPVEESISVVKLPQPYTQVAAAEGAGAFLLDNEYEEIEVELNDYTQKADIILKVVGRSTEPAIADGDCILVREQPSVNIGEIGVFILDGQGYLKERATDRLVSLNPDVEDVYVGDLQQAECYGKFIKVLDPAWIVDK